eukprot:SAG31_NODE_828_length_11716_cov_4.405785_11_plen_386_part_00
MVLETRRDLQQNSAAKAALSGKRSPPGSPVRGLSDNEALLRKEQEHMHKVMDAANRRIEKEKEEEKAMELRAQEVIEESRRFHEGLVAKMKAREQKNEKTRYKTELKRQERVRKKTEEEAEAIESGRKADEKRVQHEQIIEEQRLEREAEMRKQKLEFARVRAKKLKMAKQLQKQAEIKQVKAANELEKKLAVAEKHRGHVFRQARKAKMDQNSTMRKKVEERVGRRLAEESERTAAQKLKFEEHYDTVVERAEALKAEKEKELKLRSTIELQKEMEAEQRREHNSSTVPCVIDFSLSSPLAFVFQPRAGIEMFQSMTDKKIEGHLTAAITSEKRRVDQFKMAEEARALHLEKQKVEFEAKRLLVSGPPTAFIYPVQVQFLFVSF